MIKYLLSTTLLLGLTGCFQTEPKPVRNEHPLPKDVEIVEDITPGQYGGVFVMAFSGSPKTFNPLIAEDIPSTQAFDPIFSTIVGFDPISQKYTPALTKSWEISEDKKTYTFHLRKDIKWSDGERFSSDDIIFTFDTIFDKRYPNRNEQQLSVNGKPIAYRKIDDFSFSITTEKTYAPLLNDLVYISILPQHKLQKYVDDGSFQKQWNLETAKDNPEDIVGTGPFRISRFTEGERLILEPNPHYWKADKNLKRLPYIDFLIHKYVPDPNTQLVLFGTGQTDASGLGTSDLPWLKKAAKKYHYNVVDRGPSSNKSFIWFNLKQGHNNEGKPFVTPYKLKWFQDKRFRQAILYGLDRIGYIKAISNGIGSPQHSFVTPANKKWHNPNIRKYPYNPTKAKELLASMGFSIGKNKILHDKEGRPVEFEFMSTEAGGTSFFTILKENMKDIGINVKLTFADFSTLSEKIHTTFDYEASAMGFAEGTVDTGDPSNSKAIFSSRGRFHTWNPEQKTPATKWESQIDLLLEQQETELNEVERIKYGYKIQEILSEELPLIYLTTPQVFLGVKDCWKNLKIPTMGPALWNLDELWTDNPKNYYR